MTRLGLSALASAMALAFFAMPALAVDCTIEDNPNGPEDSGCTVTPAYNQKLLDAAFKEIEDNDDAIHENDNAIGDWDPDNPGTPGRHSVRTEIELNEEAINNNRRDFEAADEALGRKIDKNSEAIKDAISLSVAIPDSYLTEKENFALALGGGFTDGSSAFGGIGTFRINKNLSAYGGGSTLTDGGTWAAKGGVRLGW